jgi:ubiquinone biosynthesis monooxygenase Coq7
MKKDEAGHAVAAQREGAAELPRPVKMAMRAASKLMTCSSLWV